jgi:hypothetical protein
LTESLIKRINLIARSLLLGYNLPISCWGHAVLHAADLIQLRSTAYHTTSPLQLVRGDQPNISHLQKFGCVVYTPIFIPKRTSMCPHRRMGIYVGYQSSSILKFITNGWKINWDDKSILSSDPRTKETNLQVQKIIEL